MNVSNKIGEEGNVHAAFLEDLRKLAVLNFERYEGDFVLRTVKESEEGQRENVQSLFSLLCE